MNKQEFLKLGAAGAGLFAGCASSSNKEQASPELGEQKPKEQATPELGVEKPAEPGNADWPQFQYNSRNTGHHPESFGPKYTLTERWSYRTGVRLKLYRNGEVVYIIPKGGHLAAHDVHNGEQQWRNKEFSLRDAPVASASSLYAMSGGRLLELDPETGRIEWSLENHGEPTMAALTASDGMVFWPSANRRVVAFDTEAREIVWRYEYGHNILGKVGRVETPEIKA